MTDAGEFFEFLKKQEFLPHVEDDPPHILKLIENNGITFHILLPDAGHDARVEIRLPIDPNALSWEPGKALRTGDFIAMRVLSEKGCRGCHIPYTKTTWSILVRRHLGILVSTAYHGNKGESAWELYVQKLKASKHD